MLASTLTVEDEEAVQAELRELEAEAVCKFRLCIIISRTNFASSLRDSWDKHRPKDLSSFPTCPPTNRWLRQRQRKFTRGLWRKENVSPYRLEHWSSDNTPNAYM